MNGEELSNNNNNNNNKLAADSLRSFAFVLHTQFVTSDRSVENVANLKRTHSLMPYRAVAQVLKLSNPFAMVKGVLDLFLAQPFGGKSLFQR